MPQPFAITGIGVVCPIGRDANELFAALDSGLELADAGEGERALAANDDGRRATVRAGLPSARDPLVATLPAVLRQQVAPALATTPPALRRSRPHRLPRISSLLMGAAAEALASARPPHDATRIGVVFATGLGTVADATTFVRGYLDEGPEAASPLLFSHATTNACAGQLAIEYDLRGVNVTINHRDASPLAALVMACQLLELGRADVLLVAAADELSALLLHGAARFGALTPTRMRPYDLGRDGLVLGEAAAVLVLEREAEARARGARVRARITGYGETSEARPRIGWGDGVPSAEAARAVREAAGGMRIDWVAGGGNGTALDSLELGVLAAALPELPPVSSLLAQTGESFSSAALRLLGAIYALERGRIPATLGLETPPPEHAHALVRTPRAAAVERVLVPSFSQGGANVVVRVERADPLAGRNPPGP